MSIQASGQNNDVLKRLRKWRQGDFSLKCGKFLFLAEDAKAFFDESVEGLVVISQTCDIVREPQKTPYVSVCPLISVDKNRMATVRRGRAPRHYEIANAPGDIVADFCRVMSVAKELLLSWEPQPGFNDQKERVNFAYALERFFGRFAYPDEFNDSVASLTTAIHKKYNKKSNIGNVVRSISELRVLPHADWNQKNSVPVTFYVILKEENERQASHEEITGEISDLISKIKWKDPFCLRDDAGIQFKTLSQISALTYKNSFLIDINYLSFQK